MLKMNILKEFAMEKSKYSVLVVLCLMCFVSLVNAQNKSVFHSITWDEAAALAEKEGKIVFVDAMRKPMNEEAKQANEKMTRDIFKVKEVTDFINKNTIAIQIDMGSEAGKEFAPKLVMNMYPTYGFFMPNGDILGVISPFILSKEPMKLVEAGNKALEAAAVKRQNSRKIAFQNLTLDQAVEQAVANAQIDIPDPMIDLQTKQMADDFARRIMQQGMSLEQYFQFTGLSEEKMMEEFRPQAEKRIRTRLVLEAVVAAENIEVSDERLDEELKKMADSYQMEVEKLKGFMGENEKKQMKEDIAVQEAVTLIADAAVEG